MNKKYGLGRGLSSLIPEKSAEAGDQPTAGESIFTIDPKQIQTNPHQPRQAFNQAEMEELINSIREHGIIQPLVVTRLEDGSYQLIAGERRLRAAKFLNFENVPVVVRDVTEQEKLELALIENVIRHDLNPMEEAKSYNFLMEEFDLTQHDLAKRIGKSRSAVANTLRLLTLPEEIKEAIREDKISEGHARAILALDTPEEQLKLFKKIVDYKLNVRDAEKLSRRFSKKKPTKRIFDPVLTELEEDLKNKLSTKVEISKKKNKGYIKISFFSEEELNNIVDKLNKLLK